LGVPTDITHEEMERRWALFVEQKLVELKKQWGHRQVRTVFQEDSDTRSLNRDRRLRDREARLPR
jgi:hypothetical protein